MNTATQADDSKLKLKFNAGICWLGPIMGACPHGAQNVKIVGAEDPALGKGFVAVLVRVKQNGRHFEALEGKHTYLPVDWKSDRHGWFTITAPTYLWDAPAAGVLVVMLYSESRELEYYSFEDWPPDEEVRGRLSVKGTSSSRPAQAPTALPDMPEELAKSIRGGIRDAITNLLKMPAKDLRKGLAELHLAKPPEAMASRKLVLAAASCLYPSAMLENDVAGASYGRLGARLDKKDATRPQCLLLLGDQVYVDGTAGFFDPTSQYDRFVRPYEILFRMDSVRDVVRRLPACTMLDDHEIANNWEPRIDDRRPDPVMVEGRRSYFKFQRRAGPDRLRAVSDSRHPVWYSFEIDGFPLFMADTRTERMARTARGLETARIMSKGQMTALLRWLQSQPEDVPKIVATPAILLPRHARAARRNEPTSALRSDGWDGYPRSLHRVLAHIAQKKIRNVVFLSGDEHLACVARVVVDARDGDPVVLHSVHSSPMFAPFPFANSVPADLVGQDDFDFLLADDGGDTDGDKAADCRLTKVESKYNCRVDTEFAASGDGYSLLYFSRDDKGWRMECEFDRAGGPSDGGAKIDRPRPLR